MQKRKKKTSIKAKNIKIRPIKQKHKKEENDAENAPRLFDMA